MRFSEWIELKEMVGSVAAIPSCSFCDSPDFQVQGDYCSKCRGRRKKRIKTEQNTGRLADYLKSKYGRAKKLTAGSNVQKPGVGTVAPAVSAAANSSFHPPDLNVMASTPRASVR